MCSQVRVKCSSEHHVSAILQMETSRGTGRHSLKSNSSLVEEWDTLRGEMQKEREGEGEADREQGSKTEMKAFDKIPVHNDSLLYICVSGWVAHLYATAAAQCSRANPSICFTALRGGDVTHNLRLTLFVSQVSLSLSLRGFIFLFPMHHNKH